MNQKILQPLIKSIPPRISPRFCQRLEQELAKADLSLDQNGKLKGLDCETFQRVFDALTTKTDKSGQITRLAPSSRRRYKKMLLSVARHWASLGHITENIELHVSPQHRRKLVLQVDKLANCRHSDYQQMLHWLRTLITGEHQQPALAPEILSKHLPEIAIIILIACGVCFHGAVRCIASLKVRDIPRYPNHILKIQSLRGPARIHLPPLAHLMLLALAHSKSHTDELLFPCGTMQDTYKAITKFLSSASANLGKQRPTISDFIQHTRFALRMILANTELASLLGQVRSQLIPDDQFWMLLDVQSTSHEDLLPTSTFVNKNNDLAETPNNKQKATDAIDEDNEHSQMIQTYERLLEQLANDIKKAIEQSIVSPALMKAAQIETQPDNPVETNFRLLLSWLISFSDKGSPATRRAYWDSVWNGLLENWPDLALWEIGEEDITEYLDSDWAYGTISKKRAAWKSLHTYLTRLNLPYQRKIDWSQIKVNWSPLETRVVTVSDELPLMQEILEISRRLTWVVPLASELGLRVSEISRLRARDLVGGPMPYLVIHRSKNAKSRRVSLDILKPKILSKLFRVRDSSLAKDPTGNPFLIADEDGMPYTADQISGIVTVAMEATGMRGDHLEGRQPTIHRLRALAAELAYERSGDIRSAAQLLGHSMPATTIAAYILSLEVRVNQKLMQRRWAFQRGQEHIPVVVLASLLSMSDRGLMEAINAYNEQHPDTLIVLKPASDLPDGPRPPRRGRQALYISAEDAVMFVSERLRNSVRETG